MSKSGRRDDVASEYEQSAKFEHGFWLRILGDHARFIHDSLAPKEEKEIDRANYFIHTFDRLLESVGTMNMVQLSKKAEEEALRFRMVKLTLIEKLLLGKVTIHLGPTFINHMVNELEEYLRLLGYLKLGKIPPIAHALHHHLLWTLDAVGHARAISDNMDWIEKKMKEKSNRFTKDFEAFYLKAVEMTGYLRTNLSTFPALTRFNESVTLEMQLFMSFLQEIEELELSEQALGIFAPLMADHMFREECYYLTKLAQATEKNAPNCNPAKPRINK
ncbi:DUF2935 domain-containing protein [Peribacillus asahii]|uniref:DUF2935 domain-containing protein n=1 Tax=Peribacillus asahii TaxID=228899 RepID=UPI003F4AFD90